MKIVIKSMINTGLQYLTRRNDTINKTKDISRQRQTSPGSSTSVCGSCGGEIVEVNAISHRRACFKCGKLAK